MSFMFFFFYQIKACKPYLPIIHIYDQLKLRVSKELMTLVPQQNVQKMETDRKEKGKKNRPDLRDLIRAETTATQALFNLCNQSMWMKFSIDGPENAKEWRGEFGFIGEGREAHAARRAPKPIHVC
jgi:hypothetical protein